MDKTSDKNLSKKDEEQGFILFVDDNKLCHRMLELIIPSFTKYKLINAYSGEEAIVLGKKYASNIKLVLADIMMKEINGYELYKNFQNDEILKHIPFIFQSGFASEEAELKKYSISNAQIIHKPYSQEDLFATVSKILEL